MKKQLHFLVLFILMGIYYDLSAQTLSPEKLGLKAYSLTNKELGTVNYYISTNKIDTKKPVLLYLDGSGPYPLFQYTPRGTGSTIVVDFRNLSNDYHIVMISKPGVPFIDSVKTDPNSGFPIYPPPAEYTQRLSLDWRVQSADLVLNRVLQDLPVDKSKVAALGFSEGFQVGAKLATVNKQITHLLLFVGNGLTQFYDFIIQNRQDAQKGLISEEQAQSNIEAIHVAVKDIYTYPKATDKEWFGHSYLRWSSFCSNNPSENLLQLKIPIYVAGASNDRNSAVLGTDYLYLESIRQGKTNLTYKVYPYDHSFNEMLKNDTGQVVGAKSHLREVMDEGLVWLKKN